jgi:hypothetical protein
MLWSQFSAKNLPFFKKNNVMVQILQNLAVVWTKNANLFAKFFGEKYFQNHSIGSWSLWTNPFLHLIPCSRRHRYVGTITPDFPDFSNCQKCPIWHFWRIFSIGSRFGQLCLTRWRVCGRVARFFFEQYVHPNGEKRPNYYTSFLMPIKYVEWQ